MSRLSDTIGFFSPQVYRLFNETTVSTSATNYGSLTTDTITLAGASGQRSYSTDAPIGSDPGSWSLEKVTGLSDTRITHNNTNTIAQFTDRDYTFGFWVKYVTFPNNNSATANVLASVGTTSSTGSGFTLNIYGSTASAGTLRKLQLTTGNGTTTVSTIAADQFPDDGGWHYIAVRRVLSDIKVYLDGSLIITGTNPNIASAAAVGYGGIAAFPQANFTLRISHSHLFTSSAVDEAAIAAIWNAGSTLPGVTIAADPITASADQVDATIVVTGGNFTEITTSITVDATFPDAAVQAQANNNIVVTETLDALAEIGDNIQAGGSLSTSFDAVEFTASALMTDAIVSRSAMTASADIVDSTVYVDPNYFNLVKQSDPLVYCQFDSTTFVNDGSLTFTESTVVHSTVIKNVDSGNGMGLVGSGKSWKFNSGFSTSSEIYNFTELGNLDGDYTIEYWFKPTVVNAGAGVRFSNIQVGYIKDNATMYVNVGGTLPTWDILGDNIPDSSSSRYIKAQDDSIILNEWNHIVVRVESDTSTSGTVQLFINGNVAGSLSVSWNVANMLYDGFIIFDSDADEFFGPGTSNRGWYEESTQGASGSLVDQFAIYGTSLSNSTIIDHYGFIDNLSPDATVQSTPLTISATSGDHEFVVTSNAIPEIKEATASAAIVEPDIQGGKSKEVAADVVTATANAIDPSVSYDFVVEVDILAAYAESANAFALNTMYFDYVAANVLPYRYVTFDGSSSYADYGTDADYSVAPASGGTIVTPEFGINGKSAKIDGSTYTDGVILKESEWNDNWGTGQNDYHSSFWMQKAEDDNSTGLRVLWNLNGYLDNQHVILFQYQGKLHMQFNNGSGTHLDAVTTNNIDLFDGQRHFVVVAFDHKSNNNNKVHLYVDSALLLTVSLGSYTGTTVNGTTFVGPNDEANNHPRLGVGCLITPFASTALPVVPTNIKIYVDEIIWAKTEATQNLINGLYAAMPDKQNEIFTTESMTASANIVNPLISTEVNVASDSLTADIIIVEPETTADRSIVVNTTALTASALFTEATRSDEANIVADIMLASGSIGGADVKITIPGGPMLMTVTLVAPEVNGFDLDQTASTWVRYLRATDISAISVQRGVK